MVIHHPRSLHVGITNSGAEKLKAALFHILTDGVGDRRACRYFFVEVVNGLALGHKAVQVFIKRTKFLLYFDKKLRVADGGGDLAPVANDGCILHKPFYILISKRSYLFHIEIRERFSIAFAPP